MLRRYMCIFFFNDTATTEIYTLSLHDALPISGRAERDALPPVREERARAGARARRHPRPALGLPHRSEEHTSELQSQSNLVCRLLLEKTKTTGPMCYVQVVRPRAHSPGTS